MDIKRKPGRPTGPRANWVSRHVRVSPRSAEWLAEQGKKGMVISGIIDSLIQAEIKSEERSI